MALIGRKIDATPDDGHRMSTSDLEQFLAEMRAAGDGGTAVVYAKVDWRGRVKNVWAVALYPGDRPARPAASPVEDWERMASLPPPLPAAPRQPDAVHAPGDPLPAHDMDADVDATAHLAAMTPEGGPPLEQVPGPAPWAGPQ